MKEKLNLKIYEKNLNNKFKLIPFNVRKNDTGKTKYLPPYFKEWNNTAYFYNKDLIKNMPIDNLIINKLIKSYFNLLFLSYKFIAPKKKRTFLKDIYISNAEIKYTNAIAVITLYTVNIRNYLLTRYLNYFYYYSVTKEWQRTWNKNTKSWTFTRKNPLAIAKVFKNKFLRFIGIETILLKNNKQFVSNNIDINNITSIKEILKLKFKIFNNGIESYNLYRKIHLAKEIKHIYYQYLVLLYKYNYLYFFNNFKFKDGSSSFITKLKSKLSILLNKKIELNIINLKSIAYNPDIFTKALSTKLKKRRFNVIKSMITIINKGKILKKNYLKETTSLKNRNLNLLENKFKDLSLISIVNKNNLSETLKDIYSSNNAKTHKTIFDLIKYKNMGGIRLEVKGRLTKRYRADRAIYKLHWKGGLKNTDSSFRGLSSVNFRGHLKSNVAYSISKSKRRIGSFAVKGWISGK
jgi:hypothetical protein